MYCPKCGKAQQEPESYCRSCGEFLMDYSGRSYFLNKLLGGSNPSAQIGIGLAINLITIFTSILLLGFLNGHYDAREARTGEGAPPIIYLVYLFLVVISLWQILSSWGEAPDKTKPEERLERSGKRGNAAGCRFLESDERAIALRRF